MTDDAARQKILNAFGVTEADIEQLESANGWKAAREEADRERQRFADAMCYRVEAMGQAIEDELWEAARMPRKSMLCPFCGVAVVDVYLDHYLIIGNEMIESVIRAHLTKQHPIRSRLNRKARKAIRESDRLRAAAR